MTSSLTFCRSVSTMALAMAAIALPTVAEAQGTTQPATAQQTQGSPVDDAIVVTARKREETIQNVPTTVTAVGSESLETRAVTDLRALSGYVPNVTVEQATTSSSGSQIFLRGIGIDNTGFNTDPTVGVYLDDIFIGRLVGSMVGALDMERIEVLRGPQGTLYGRNATAGAVKYVTVKPNLDDSSAKFSATVGSRDRVTLRGSANIVLVPDKLALLASAQWHKQEGYITLYDAAGADTGLRSNARDVQDYRLALRYQASDAMTIDITGDYSHNRSGLQSLTPTNCAALGTRPGTVYDAATDSFGPGQVNAGQLERCPLFYNDPYASYIGPFNYNDPKFDSAGISGTIAYDLDWATLKSVTGYRGFRDIFVSALYAKPLPSLNVNLVNRLKQRQFQQEFQLSSNGRSFIDYTVGLFYYNEKVDSDYRTQIGAGAGPLPLPRLNLDSQKTNSYAVYGEIYIHPMERLELTLGGRMSWDNKDVDRQLFPTTASTTPSLTYKGSIKTDVFTPKIGISYQLEDALLYATYSQGYRSAGWANTTATSLANLMLEFGTEDEKSYEAGIKSQFFDRRLTLNLAAFQAEYNNLQATLTANGQTIVVTSDARIQGLELEASVRPLPGLNIFGNLALMKDKYLKQPPGLFYARRLKHLARESFLLGFNYDQGVPQIKGNIFLGADVRYQGKAFRNVANTIDQKSGAYTLVNAHIGYRSEDERYTVTLGGTNITNKTYYLLGTENQTRSYQPPREWYLTLATQF
ncbi:MULTISPECIES: TonB-dependent receptor [Sphingobium]|uniref:TonB-dependent receptor n=1 Tax=Sphingobium sp. MI1205 TaxID=407020 RepID=UPI0007702A90|nr:TonB-dependent receptor [Sphingobium sp. MI1205]AMK19990.1 TonB-dependent receptor [Sphingobium sp. MI1205]